ncbi:hypothetical protein [Sphingomonas turrisvirgatae]|uniref:Uncharacterized protein n=1 Tax=Sphingomonas turrisvirgatae TaxID=1888892 RepID=A0A1E3LR64_9SPHN|nr:hypothetical protein [Sphingomonas turrisvirgatae]ODP36223.1 hypothetical protein BFL28_07405 [Sphingomonas turrisvirgatae]
MIEDDDGDRGEAPFARSYDFFKHMTGITLISIGGVFALMDNSAAKLDTKSVVVVLAALGMSGVTCLLMTNALVTLEVKPEPHDKMARKVRVGLVMATFFLAVGLGSFVPSFTSALLK